jgi:DNA-binding transcriptional LysR family regulator
MLERELRTFVAVADLGAMVVAARHLSYSPSSVTQHMNSLERVLGTRLIHREHSGITLTEAGSALLPLARSIVTLSASLEELAALFGGCGSRASVTVRWPVSKN